MDRSYLSDTAVIEASRQFVCARLATYEDADEGAFLKSVFRGRTGELENSVFALLAPDGKTKLARAGRSPDFAFENSAEMASTMQTLAEKHVAERASVKQTAPLPVLEDLRLALNVASSDLNPLVVVVAKSAKDGEKAAARLAEHVWGEKLIGRAEYVIVTDAKQLTVLDGAKADAGYLVVAPDEFGLKGKVLASIPAAVKDTELAEKLDAGLKEFTAPSKRPRDLIRKGRSEGVNWETEIPVTDPHDPGKKDGGRRGPPPDDR